MTFLELLGVMVKRKASDLFITADAPPSLKINGEIKPFSQKPLNEKTAVAIVLSSMNDEQRQEYEREWECSFAVHFPALGRFRVSVYKQRTLPAMVVRCIQRVIPSPEDLDLPPVLKQLVSAKRGLVLLVGSTSTGKSTSLASLIDYRNRTQSGHIITIEDPIEFIHTHKKSIIAQREIGIDTVSFERALQNALRQTPDVILMGEIRSADVMKHALSFAETGHLCLATLHANNANQALDRILSFFPPEQHAKIWMDLSFNLKGVVAQMLLPSLDGKTRRLAVEVMLNTPLVRELIRNGEIYKIKDVMKVAADVGMQTFDQALFKLHQQGLISYETALTHADSENDLRLMIKLADSSASIDDGHTLNAVKADHGAIQQKKPMGKGSGTATGFTFLPDMPVSSAPLIQDRKQYVDQRFDILPENKSSKDSG
ncbi:twitching motility protein PilU [Marinobacterium halophilum]|uniref:Twitching motility protein PilU n=1 Tax=Marinobacterium halophilum TaxID=267374 RepID=A0A2P8F362_9GAMM|nr:PilT/PilU family type 4a pilus ATPase [Marinobacterium halophilum]PSL16150.1 twitching motility protein PilU [Marinobacterium halophilum]